MNVSGRQEIVKSNTLCYNCLSSDHFGKNCNLRQHSMSNTGSTLAHFPGLAFIDGTKDDEPASNPIGKKPRTGSNELKL